MSTSIGRKRYYYWGGLCLLIFAGFLIWRGIDRAGHVSGAYYQGPVPSGGGVMVRLRPGADYHSVAGSITSRTNVFDVFGEIRLTEIIAHSLMTQPFQQVTNSVIRGRLIDDRLDLSVSNSHPTNGTVGHFSAEKIAEERRYSKSKIFRLGRYGASQKAASHFPQIIADSFSAADELNSSLDRLAKEQVEDFQLDFWSLVKDGFRFPGPSFDWVSESDFELVLVTSNLVSLRFLNYVFTGGAHGNYVFHGVNYYSDDAKSVREFHLEEVFDEKSSGIQICEAECLTRLREQGAGYIDDESVISFDEDDLSAFTLCDAGLVFHFSPYHVGPYSQGAFHVLVPAEPLRGTLSRSGAGMAIERIWFSTSH
ncbi:DUF3298 and DUF4163 domain-containing protein [bacterium]|nr:DUF3298 and DUF4163 domain-containing protein [bacterium]